jgi:hypothetical protein
MTSLYETAINGIGIGTKREELDTMYRDHEGFPLAQALILNLGMALDDLQRAERMGAQALRSLTDAVERCRVNQTVSQAEWIVKYAREVQDYAREAATAYARTGEAFRVWKILVEEGPLH